MAAKKIFTIVMQSSVKNRRNRRPLVLATESVVEYSSPHDLFHAPPPLKTLRGAPSLSEDGEGRAHYIANVDICLSEKSHFTFKKKSLHVVRRNLSCNCRDKK